MEITSNIATTLKLGIPPVIYAHYLPYVLTTSVWLPVM